MKKVYTIIKRNHNHGTVRVVDVCSSALKAYEALETEATLRGDGFYYYTQRIGDRKKDICSAAFFSLIHDRELLFFANHDRTVDYHVSKDTVNVTIKG